MRVARLHSITPIRNFLEFQDFLDGSCLDDLWSSSEKSDPTPLCDPVRLCPQSFSAVERDIDVHGSVEVTPRVRELARGSLTANAFSSYSGPIVSRRKGEGMEFADIREYTHGDPFKRIEWKSTARTGELMVRELHAETTLNVMIILDASDTMAYGQAGQTKLDYSARAVASLINYLSKRGDFFGLTIVQGQRPARVIPLARGQVQITRILNLLGQLQPTPASPELLAQAITRSLKLGRVKGRTLFFILTDLETKEELGSLSQLRAMRHEAV